MIRSLIIKENDIFAGTIDGGVFLSSNNGANWTNVSDGLPIVDIFSIAISGTNIFVATYGLGVWVRPLSELNNTGIKQINDDANKMIFYPNPARDIVTLKNDKAGIFNIYDVKGVLLKSEKLYQNQQQINISDLSEGIYIAEIKTDGLSQKQKLVVQK